MTTRSVSLATDAGRTFEADYRVRFDEAGPDGSLRTSGYMRYAQDVAWRHSEALSFGREWYAARALTWLVRAAELAILADVPMGTVLTARTLVVGMRRVFARRRGEFRLPDGELAGWVHTDWVMIDGRGALTRIPPIFGDLFGGDSMTGQVGRVALPPAPDGAPRRRFGVRPHELDPMDHVNNAVYLDWLEEAILASDPAAGGAVAVAMRPRHYRLEYAMAAAADALVEGTAWADEHGWSHRLVDATTGTDLFRARLEPGTGDEEER
ncbi:MAG TPA: acyl-ACP thioesterase domain-containing protein [Candidatus Limnocylindrales bacterium]|nr:acyl-ACP thioesterase domain-containing protein [Candidatus Limnocylindrales bacterium]